MVDKSSTEASLSVGPGGPAGRCNFREKRADGWASRPYRKNE